MVIAAIEIIISQKRKLGTISTMLNGHLLVLVTIACWHFNPIPTGGGGGVVPPPPPPQVHFLKYLRNALSYGLETF